MARKFYTIMIVPHNRAKFRNLHVSKNFLLFSAALAAVLTVATVLLPRYLLLSREQGRTLEQLRLENEALRSANDAYDHDVAQLRTRLADYEQMANKFALMAGVTDLPADELPAGSPGELPVDLSAWTLRPDYLNEEIAILKDRADALDENYRVLDRAYVEKSVRLSTTPSIAPTRGIMGSGYNYRRDPFTGQREFHAGLDIVANSGTPVLATADGVVTQAGRFSSYGKAVFVSHGNGTSTRYAHLSEVDVKAGQRVKRGDRLGRVGATGRAMGFHLHYEVIIGGKKVDPLRYILDENRIY